MAADETTSAPASGAPVAPPSTPSTPSAGRPPRATRKALPVINPARCTGCGWCVGVCPPHVLSLHTAGGRKTSTLDGKETDYLFVTLKVG